MNKYGHGILLLSLGLQIGLCIAGQTPAATQVAAPAATSSTHLASAGQARPAVPVAPVPDAVPAKSDNQLARGVHNIADDYQHYYAWHNLKWLGYGVLGSALFANTRLDEHINSWYQAHLVNAATNRFAAVVKHPGNDRSILVYLAAGAGGWVLQRWQPGGLLFNWSTRTMRSLLVGAPPVLILQRVLGTSRPTHGSQWQPFHAAHAVSGHAFLGSLPFLTAAQMTQNKFFKGIFYVGSGLTGWSRLNDNAHYFSQVILGWWMGYLAVNSVSATVAAQHVSFSPYVWDDGTPGLQCSFLPA